MCGIVGWSNINKNISDNTEIVVKMRDTLINRGPDSCGVKTYENAILGHRRLAIVDPTGGLQPMTKNIKNNEYTIVYNGELYNTDEVRDDLIKKGYSFNTYSDTEVLLVSYIEYGSRCVDKINGIYAFGIWNENEKELFLARDPLGVKPLFYSLKDGGVIFGSEIKAILKHPSVDSVVDKEGVLELISLSPQRKLGSGIFKDIKEVPPAHSLTYNEKGVKLYEYWKLS